MRNLITTAILALALFPLVGSAQITGEFSTLYTSAYTFRGAQLADESIQPYLKLELGNLYATAWSNVPLDSGQDNELDFSLGYSAEGKPFDLDLGVMAYHYPDAGDTTWEGYLGISRSFGGFTPSLVAYYDWTLKVFTYQGGFSYEIPVAKRFTLAPRAVAGYIDPSGGKGSYYWEGGLEASFSFTEKASAFVGGAYTSSDVDLAKKDIWTYSGGIRFSF